MTYAALTNWKYDKSIYHNIQSGPQRTGSNLNLTDTYLLTSSGYVYASGEQQTFVQLRDVGANFGIITPGPPNASGYLTTDWRAVPIAVSGYWTDYENIYQHASGVLTVYNGYRRQGLISTANSTVQTAFGPEPGLKDRGPFVGYRTPPDNNRYDPFLTPASSADDGSTGGGVSYPLAQYPTLSRTTGSGTANRAEWQYNPPIYCQSLVESVRSDALPGDTASGKNTIIRNMYRGKSSRYVPNYGSVYGVLGDGIRGMIRTFSSTVNSSNQKNI
tara:strand:+ start:59 stop:880 length:822 start_codon:yes stop_codon:yes gene_type:complete